MGVWAFTMRFLRTTIALQNHIYYSNANKAKDQAPVPGDSYGTLRTDSMLSWYFAHALHTVFCLI